MLYAVLCYNDETEVARWTEEQDEACMARLMVVQQKMAEQGKLGPVLRLQNTTEARTLKKSAAKPMLVDGPFAETKEQFLGFYVVDCDTIEEAEAFVQDLALANPGNGSYEIRPVRFYANSEPKKVEVAA